MAYSFASKSESSPQNAAQNQRTSVLSLIILVCVWFFTQLTSIFSPGLMDDVDGIHTEAAREMFLRHDLVTLYVDGIRYLDKPPLPYWLGALGIRIFGMHDWAVRLSLAIPVLVLTLYLYSMGRRWFNERTGFYSACAFATAVGPYIFTRFFIPDVILALWITMAADVILRMVRSVETEGKATLMQASSFALLCTAAVLTKGLIGIVFPVGLLLLYLVLTGRTKYLLKMRPVLGIGVFLLTALPWHILADIQNQASGESRGWFWFYFINEQVNRYLNKRIPRDYDKVPLLTFWALLIVWLMPWGIYLGGVIRQWWSERRPLRGAGPRFLFALWAFVIVGFFTFSTRQEYYTLPAVPALALLVGIWLASEDHAPTAIGTRWVRVSSGILLGVGVLVAVLCGYFAIVSHTPPQEQELFQALNSSPDNYALSFGHLFDLTTTALGFFRVPLAGMAISMFVMTGLSFFFRMRNKAYAANLTLTVGMCAVLACVHMGLKGFYPILGSEQLAQAIQQQWQPGDKVVLDGEYSNGSSINFYMGEPVYMLNGRINNLWYGSLYADAPRRFEDNASFLQLWQGSGRIFFVTHDLKRTQEWQRDHGGKVVASSSGKYVLLNRAK